ncbi:MAG: helix-turn-helix domain-containing protein [Bacilli bacterium]
MQTLDLEFLCTSLSQLSGIPVRIYNNKKQTFFYSLVYLPKDPIILLGNKIFENKENIGYIATNDFFYYGYLNFKNNLIIIGPSRQIKPNDSLLQKIAFELEVEKDDLDAFKSSVKSIVSMPLESLLQSLCMFNYVLNKEKKNVKDLLINDTTFENMNKIINKEILNNQVEFENVMNYEHNTKLIEDELCRMVEHGDIVELKEWIKKAPAVRSGQMSNDSLRQIKNIFIASTTLISRSAIKGMLDVNEALSLSDLYIQKMELMQKETDVATLQLNMVIDFTERVARIKGKKDASSFLISLNKYIYNHLSDPIKSQDICNALFISKSVLFDKIKKETGKTLSQYILNVKINEAKGLLKYTNKNFASISLYLGFSSQSHFNKTFKLITGYTPLEYKVKHVK